MLSPTRLLPALLFLAAALASCGDDDDAGGAIDDNRPDSVAGLNFAQVDAGDADSVYASIRAALDANPAVGIPAEVDHALNATTAGVTLRPTRLLLFGNPNLGTPLMQANQQAGLDLPQKMLVYKDADGDVVVAYNNADYLGARHGVDTVGTLATISGALETFAGGDGARSVTAADAGGTSLDEGIVTTTSALSFDATASKLDSVIESLPALTLVSRFDHAANAAGVGLELRPTTLFIFGNPALGSPLMADAQSIGIDLPQKMLLYEDADGTVHVAYNDIAFLAERHGVSGDLPQLEQIAMALDNIAAAITTP